MKFNTLIAFEKHLNKAMPSHLSDVYLIIDPEHYMQRKLALTVTQKGESLECYNAEGLSLGEMKQAIEMGSLFELKKCCVFLGIEKLSKACLDSLEKAIKTPNPQVRIVLSASQMTPLCQKILKSVVTLDLSAEKPWDRDRRLTDYVCHSLKKESLFISTALAELVVKMTGGQVSIIDQEIEKLICYLKNKKEVKREDLSILHSNDQYSIFKVGECLLERRLKDALSLIHSQAYPIIPLIYTLRNLFQRALSLKELNQNDIGTYFPMLKGKFLEKNLAWVKSFSKAQFKKALLILFEMEVMTKNQTLPENFLESLLLLKLGAADESLSV